MAIISRVFLFAFVLFSTLIAGHQVAMADLTITPTRVVFGDRDRFATITLVNTGDKPKTYEMHWKFFRMQEEGPAYAPSETSTTPFDLSQHIMFTPRRVTLAPGAKQKVRLALRRPPEVPPGDYHAHLEFAGIREEEPIAQAQNAQDSKQKAGAQVKINVGYSIPVILRVGAENVKATIDQISIDQDEVNKVMIVKVPLKREGGPYSVLGHLFVYHITPDGKEERVGEISNAHIFPEVNRRVFEVRLIKQVSGGSLKVVMNNYDKNNPYTYAEKTFPLQ